MSDTTEIITLTHLGKTFEGALQAYGKRLTDEQIAGQLSDLNDRHVDYIVNYVGAGLMILARKASLPHGEFRKWAESFTESKCSCVNILKDRSYVTYRRMMWFARHFVWQLTKTPAEERQLNSVAPETALAMVMGGRGESHALEERIRAFVGSCTSLDELRKDLNSAAKLADSARDEDEDDDLTAPDKPGPATPPRQIDFWDQLDRDFTPIYENFKHLLDQPYWAQASGENAEKAVRAARARIKELDDELRAREQALAAARR